MQSLSKENILLTKKYCREILPYFRNAIREYYNRYNSSQIGSNKFFWKICSTLTPIYEQQTSNAMKKEFLRELVRRIKKVPYAKNHNFTIKNLEERCQIYPQLSSIKEDKSMALIKSITTDACNFYSSFEEIIASTSLEIQKFLLKKCKNQQELQFYFILCVSESLDKEGILCYMYENAFKNYQKILKQKGNRIKKQNELSDIFRIDIRYDDYDRQEKRVKKFINLNDRQKDDIKKLFEIYKVRLKKNDLDFIQANLLNTYCSNYRRFNAHINEDKCSKKLEEWKETRIWNKIMDYFDTENVKIQPSLIDKNGLGVFAKRDIPENTNILYYKGRKIPKDIFHDLAKNEDKMYSYAFGYNKDLTIDGYIPENKARYFNHSCAPNCFATTRNKEIWIISNRRIFKGEELTFNYGYTNKSKKITCKCGAKNCCGYIVSYNERTENYNLEEISD